MDKQERERGGEVFRYLGALIPTSRKMFLGDFRVEGEEMYCTSDLSPGNTDGFIAPFSFFFFYSMTEEELCAGKLIQDSRFKMLYLSRGKLLCK